ncbi:MAG: SAF domain-containing protein [Acidimicrobiales bacterium]
MPTATEPTSQNGHRTLTGARPRLPTSSAAGRRHQRPWIVGGVLLVVVCALAFALTSVRLSGGQEVLVVARSVPAGRLVTPGDLATVRVTAGSGIRPVPAADQASVVGRPAAVPLVAGTLLTAAQVGSPGAVSGDRDLVAVGLKAGQYPPSLSAGDRVSVVPVAAGTGSDARTTAPSMSSTPTVATVVAVDTAAVGSGGDTVVSLAVSQDTASSVAVLAAAGEVSLVQLPSRKAGT